jgi:thioredoxin reductase (NADPH)
MSDYLTREIGSAANVHVRYRSEVAGSGGNGRLEHLLIRDRDSGPDRITASRGAVHPDRRAAVHRLAARRDRA